MRRGQAEQVGEGTDVSPKSAGQAGKRGVQACVRVRVRAHVRMCVKWNPYLTPVPNTNYRSNAKGEFMTARQERIFKTHSHTNEVKDHSK